MNSSGPSQTIELVVGELPGQKQLPKQEKLVEQTNPIMVDHPIYAQLKAMGVPDENLAFLWEQLGANINEDLLQPGSELLVDLQTGDLVEDDMLADYVRSTLSTSRLGTMFGLAVPLPATS